MVATEHTYPQSGSPEEFQEECGLAAERIPAVAIEALSLKK